MPVTRFKRKRVLWLSHFLPWPPKGGLLQRSYHLMRGVGGRHDLQVVAFRQRAHQPNETLRSDAVSAISEFARIRSVYDLPQDRLWKGAFRLALRSSISGLPYTVRWGMCAEYGKAVESAVEEFRPDVVHFDTVSLSTYLNLLGDIPAILNHHNVESHMLLRRSRHEPNWIKRLYFRQEARRVEAFERQVAGRYAAHLVCAQSDAERLHAAVGAVPTKIVPNGVDLDYFQPAPPDTLPEPESLIFVGGMSWYPNASAMRYFLRDIWPKLTQRHPAACLRVVGRSPPRDLLRLSAGDPRVEFLGFVEDIRPLVHRSSVYVCPIFDGGGTKLKMLDAMAMGSAIVAHPAACEGLDLTDGREVLIASRADDFVRCIVQAFGSPQLRHSLGEEGRRHVESRFCADSISREYATFLGTVRSGGSGLQRSTF